MRQVLTGLVFALALAACAGATYSRGVVSAPLPSTVHSQWPFPEAPRGSAAAPPAAATAAGAQAAPPEGVTVGGVDFGQWRSADPETYETAFQAQMRHRMAGKNAEQMSADLTANGFACESGATTQCRIEIMERQCGYDWYVVMEPNNPVPVAGFDQMCLGARSGGQ